MNFKSYALAACALLVSVAFSQDRTYKVREGDSLSKIASRTGVSQSQILKANKLANPHKLKPGVSLRIPKAFAAKSSQVGSKTVSKPSKGGYAVKPGDVDEKIAKRLGVSVAQLRAANPGVKWTRLQIGQSIRVPGSSAPAKSSKVASKSGATPRLANFSNSYKVKEGDNDWIIAKRVGTTPSKIRAANPGLNWERIRPGQTIKVPGSPKPTLASGTKINSRYAIIASNAVNVRAKPETGARKVTQVDQGRRVVLLDRASGWYKVQFGGGTTGWVRGDFLAATKAPAKAKPVYASNKTRNSRASSSKTTVASTNRPRGRRGDGLVASLTPPDTELAVLKDAYSLKGNLRYKWGSMSRSAADCSGFVSVVYKGQGIKLPRTSREMSTHGQAVGKSGLKPGDLVFFHTRRSSRVNHVGIYAGNGKFIHSSSSYGGVRVDKIDSGYYSRAFAGARRVTNSPKTVSTKKEPKKEETRSEQKNAEPADAPKPVEPSKPVPGADDIIK